MGYKKSAALAVVLIFIFGVVISALIQSPPTKIKPDNHEGESEQAGLLSATFDKIDSSTAKIFAFKVEGLNSEAAANKVADALHSTFEGYIGKVTADLGKQIFTMECDPARMSEEKALAALNAAGYKAELISYQQP